jgi:hypothetical protein
MARKMKDTDTEEELANLEKANADNDKERQLEIERLNQDLKATNGFVFDQVAKLTAEIDTLKERDA